MKKHVVFSLFVLLLCAKVAFGCDLTKCQTPYDNVPRMDLPSTISSIKDGPWSSPSTWDAGRVPAGTDKVAVNHTVDFYGDGVADVIGVSENLVFSPVLSSKLTVTTVLVLPGGKLTKVSSPSSLELVIRDAPMDAGDPLQYGHGIVAIDGEVRLEGLPTTSIARLALEPVGSTLVLQNTPIGWSSGDSLFIPDSRHVPNAENGFVPKWELPTVQSVSGTNVGLTAALSFTHPGAKNMAGQIDFYPHVVNLTRNVVIRSENPLGIRGHMLFTGKSSVSLVNIAVQDMGRTTWKPISSTNLVGRYPIHMHHMIGVLQPNGRQFTLQGSVVYSDMTTANIYKWPITLHDSHYGLVQDNVLLNCGGACFMAEDGSETENVITHNFAARSTGSSDRYGHGSEPTGYWFRGPNNRVTNNIAANILGPDAAYPSTGFSLWQEGTGNVKIPPYQGADYSSYGTVNSYALPLLQFEGNEIYSSSKGITAWWIGTELRHPKASAQSTIKDLKLWHVFFTGIVHYQAHKLTWDGLIIRGNQSVKTWTAYNGGDYFASENVITRANIQGVSMGIQPPTDVLGGFRIENSFIQAVTGVEMDTLWTSAYETSIITPRLVEMTNVQFATADKDIRMQYSATPVRSLIRKDELKIVDTGLQVYYSQQNPGFIIPKSVVNANGTFALEASPTLGLTNQQNFAATGIAIAGSIAPCMTLSPKIVGYICPLAALPVITVQPVSQDIACSRAALAVISNGTTYQWQKNGVDIPGATLSTYVTECIEAGVYTVRVSNQTGSVLSNPATVTFY